MEGGSFDLRAVAPASNRTARERAFEMIRGFCERNGIDVPAIEEVENGGTIALHGAGPDGLHFAFGVEP